VRSGTVARTSRSESTTRRTTGAIRTVGTETKTPARIGRVGSPRLLVLLRLFGGEVGRSRADQSLRERDPADDWPCSSRRKITQHALDERHAHRSGERIRGEHVLEMI